MSSYITGFIMKRSAFFGLAFKMLLKLRRKTLKLHLGNALPNGKLNINTRDFCYFNQFLCDDFQRTFILEIRMWCSFFSFSAIDVIVIGHIYGMVVE